ncbi:MAG: putative toxin-antitoxin system toxin component, PIN family [Candidatus Helarchaeota archaeon]|nr:putative toxin-antitoxin system toxin component, PIN family [Candidatus Helarchaeota archaeon]
MKLVIDTNILISGLIKKSTTRKILLNPKFYFYLPEFLFNELARHLPEIVQKSNLDIEEIKKLINLFLENLNIVPIKEYENQIKKATEIMGHIDEKDIPFIAVALAIKSDGIWSNDKHFQKQSAIKIYTTENLMSFL